MATMAGSWADLLGHLVAGNDLSAEETAWAMNQVMTGEATPAQVAAFAVALRAKGESAAEVSGMADTMLAHARPLRTDQRAVDIVGTGGDRIGTVNISTMTSIVVAAAGGSVVKHGNRAASSKCGTADVLEELGVTIDLPPDEVRRCVDELGIGFCFAPVFHPAFKYTSSPRREIGIPTAFNLLGPLTNPGQPSAGLIGCADPVKAPVLAEVFAARGSSVLLVRGDDGMDEITTSTGTTAWIVHNGTVRQERIEPTEFGIPLSAPRALLGGDAKQNAAAVRAVLAGEHGPVRDAVVLNVAGALAAYDGIDEDLFAQLRTDIARAEQAIDSGAAMEVLTRWADRSTELEAPSG